MLQDGTIKPQRFVHCNLVESPLLINSPSSWTLLLRLNIRDQHTLLCIRFRTKSAHDVLSESASTHAPFTSRQVPELENAGYIRATAVMLVTLFRV